MLLGLHVVTSRTLAQPPPAGPDEERARTVRVPLDQPVLITSSPNVPSKAPTVDNPAIARVENVPDNPFVLRVKGIPRGGRI